MPFDYDQLIAGVRLDLLEPDEWRPSDDFILQKAGDVVQALVTESANTQAEWAQRSTEATQGQNEQELILNNIGSDYGKPVRVEVFDPQRPRLRPTKVELLGIHNRDSVPSGLDAASFFRREDGTPVLRFLEPAVRQRELRIWWEWGELPGVALGSIMPVIHPLHRYTRVLTSLACVGTAWWSALAANLDEAKAEVAMQPRRAAIVGDALKGAGLAGQAVQMREAWSNYKWSSRQAGEGYIGGYADEFEQYSRSDLWIWG